MPVLSSLQSLMAPPKPEPQIMIPYAQLLELLDVAQQVPLLRKEVKRLSDQVLALRMIQSECMEKIGQLEKLL